MIFVCINYYCVVCLMVIFIFPSSPLYLLVRMLVVSGMSLLQAFLVGRVRKYTYSSLHTYIHTSTCLSIYPSCYEFILWPGVHIAHYLHEDVLDQTVVRLLFSPYVPKLWLKPKLSDYWGTVYPLLSVHPKNHRTKILVKLSLSFHLLTHYLLPPSLPKTFL